MLFRIEIAENAQLGVSGILDALEHISKSLVKENGFGFRVDDQLLQFFLMAAEAEREFFVLESALLIENGYDKILDSMWYIYCEESVRSERLRTSRGYSDEKIRSIMKSQVSDGVFRQYCDVVIDNTGPLTGEGGALSQVDAAIAALREKFI